MKITVQDRTAKTVDELLGPDDNLVFRCLSCMEWYLPREFHLLSKRYRADDGYVYSEAIELCPGCFPNPEEARVDEIPHSSAYEIWTREQFLERRRYEKSGLIAPPEKVLVSNT